MKKDVVLPATRRAITIARIIFVLPAPAAYLGTMITVTGGPMMYPGLAEPLLWYHSPDFVMFFWLVLFVACNLFLASMLLQAYGKLPEIEQIGVDGTEKIFSIDAIIEMLLVLVTVTAFASHGMITNPHMPNEQVLVNVATMIVGIIAVVLFLKSIINTKRGCLSTEEFKAWTIKQAAVLIFGITPVVMFVIFITHACAGFNVTPVDLVEWAQSKFESLTFSLACTNESVALDAIATLECTRSLCGFDSWQTACQRAHVAEGNRAIHLFAALFPIHLLLTWAVVVLHSHGLTTKHTGTETKSSYVHLFQPHMLVAGLLLLYVNSLQLYQLARLFLLAFFLMQRHPIDEIIQMPGVCYGSCASFVFLLSWIAAWCAIVLILNFDRLRGLVMEQKERARNKQARATVEEGWIPRVPSFYFMPADYVRNLSARALPRFQELRNDGVLEKRSIKLAEAFRGEGGIKSILFISHRWEEPVEPDRYGNQLAAIQEHLHMHRDIAWVWYDYSCMPQRAKDGTDERTVEEMTEFSLMLSAIADLYMTSLVLILLDKSYDSRFWPLTESWCAMQQVTMDGLGPTEQGQERYTIKCIHDANEKNKSFLIDYVSKKTEREMRQKLAMADVNVTNMKDKETMLPIIQEMDKHVISIMRELGDESAPSLSSVPPFTTYVQPFAKPR